MNATTLTATPTRIEYEFCDGSLLIDEDGVDLAESADAYADAVHDALMAAYPTVEIVSVTCARRTSGMAARVRHDVEDLLAADRLENEVREIANRVWERQDWIVATD